MIKELWFKSFKIWLVLFGFFSISMWIGNLTFLGGIGFLFFCFTLYFLALSAGIVFGRTR